MENKINLNLRNLVVIGVAAWAFTLGLNLVARTVVDKNIPLLSRAGSIIQTSMRLGAGS